MKQEGGVYVLKILWLAARRVTEGQMDKIWGANNSEYGTALMGKSGTKMIMRL